MTTSEQTYSLLAITPVQVANSDPLIYYWRGVALTQPMLLALIGSIIFRIPVSPEMRIMAGRAQRHAVLSRQIEDCVSITEQYSNQDIDQVYYHAYSAALRNQIHEADMFQHFSVDAVLNWVRPQETT